MELIPLTYQPEQEQTMELLIPLVYQPDLTQELTLDSYLQSHSLIFDDKLNGITNELRLTLETALKDAPKDSKDLLIKNLILNEIAYKKEKEIMNNVNDYLIYHSLTKINKSPSFDDIVQNNYINKKRELEEKLSNKLVGLMGSDSNAHLQLLEFSDSLDSSLDLYPEMKYALKNKIEEAIAERDHQETFSIGAMAVMNLVKFLRKIFKQRQLNRDQILEEYENTFNYADEISEDNEVSQSQSRRNNFPKLTMEFTNNKKEPKKEVENKYEATPSPMLNIVPPMLEPDEPELKQEKTYKPRTPWDDMMQMMLKPTPYNTKK